MLTLGVEQNVIGDVFFPHGHQGFDHGVTSSFDVEGGGVVHNGANIFLRSSQMGEGVVAVEVGEGLGIVLECYDTFRCSSDQLTVKTRFENENLIFCTEDFLLIFFEFLRDVAFGIDQRLFANPLFGHKLFVGVAHLHVVAKDIVESNFQTLDAGACDFAFLDLEEVVFARGLDVAQFIEVRIHSFVDDSAFVHQ